jgi:hypothetical protein
MNLLALISSLAFTLKLMIIEEVGHGSFWICGVEM